MVWKKWTAAFASGRIWEKANSVISKINYVLEWPQSVWFAPGRRLFQSSSTPPASRTSLEHQAPPPHLFFWGGRWYRPRPRESSGWELPVNWVWGRTSAPCTSVEALSCSQCTPTSTARTPWIVSQGQKRGLVQGTVHSPTVSGKFLLSFWSLYLISLVTRTLPQLPFGWNFAEVTLTFVLDFSRDTIFTFSKFPFSFGLFIKSQSWK